MHGENRLPASTGGAEVTGTCGKNRMMNLGAVEVKKEAKNSGRDKNREGKNWN
jgi:hypothetical protein